MQFSPCGRDARTGSASAVATAARLRVHRLIRPRRHAAAHFFDETLTRLGWVEGKNLEVRRRFSGSAGAEQSSVAADLVAWRPDVIVAAGTIDALPLLALTRSIPIVVVTSPDPVRQGLAATLAHPGGNVTGTAAVTTDLFPKLLEFVHDLVPGVSRVSVLSDPEILVTSNCFLGRQSSRSDQVTRHAVGRRSSMRRSPWRQPMATGRWLCSARQ